MRKTLTTVTIVCFALSLTTGVMAAEISWSGSVEFGITGSNDSWDLAGKGELKVIGSATYGPWTGETSVKGSKSWGAEPTDNLSVDGYLKYSEASFEFTLDPLGIGNDLYDLGVGDLSSNAGIKLETTTGLPFFVVANKEAAVDNYNIGGGVNFSTGDVGLGATFNSNQTKDLTSYAGKVTYKMGALSLIGEYGAVSDGTSRYYGEIGYPLVGGFLTASYLGGEDYSQVKGEFSRPVFKGVDLEIEIITTTKAGKSTTSYETNLVLSL